MAASLSAIHFMHTGDTCKAIYLSGGLSKDVNVEQRTEGKVYL